MIAAGGEGATQAAMDNKWNANITSSWMMVGSTGGAVVNRADCKKDPTNPVCADVNIKLQYVTAFASFRINSEFSQYMTNWRNNGGTCPFHTG
jgi:hypothetical protein